MFQATIFSPEASLHFETGEQRWKSSVCRCITSLLPTFHWAVKAESGFQDREESSCFKDKQREAPNLPLHRG